MMLFLWEDKKETGDQLKESRKWRRVGGRLSNCGAPKFAQSKKMVDKIVCGEEKK